jgi:hypothetical protein
MLNDGCKALLFTITCSKEVTEGGKPKKNAFFCDYFTISLLINALKCAFVVIKASFLLVEGMRYYGNTTKTQAGEELYG